MEELKSWKNKEMDETSEEKEDFYSTVGQMDLMQNYIRNKGKNSALKNATHLRVEHEDNREENDEEEDMDD